MTNQSLLGSCEALDYYSEHVVPALAVAVAISEKFPQKILNELRNALTHIARANTLIANGEIESAAQEENLSLRHMKRTALDCLKIAVIAYARKSEEALKALLEEVALPENVHKNAIKLRDERIRISTVEGQQPTQNTVSEYSALLNDYSIFYKDLGENFSGDTATARVGARQKREKVAKWRSLVVGLVLGIFGSWFAGQIPAFNFSKEVNASESAIPAQDPLENNTN